MITSACGESSAAVTAGGAAGRDSESGVRVTDACGTGTGRATDSAAAPGDGTVVVAAGLVAGLGIGMVAALLGVAGGELLIPTIVILFGMDVKVAGSLSLCVSLPTMIVGFARYRQAEARGAAEYNIGFTGRRG